jgi:hypothetical protein
MTRLKDVTSTSIARTRSLLAARNVCDPACAGWFIDGETSRVEACDACRTPWADEGRERCLYDDQDVQLLPEARAARIVAAGLHRLGDGYPVTYTLTREPRAHGPLHVRRGSVRRR